MTIVGGIDEAGRGPVLGPMVIAGIEGEEDYITKWAKWGIKDSKQLTAEKREELYEKLVFPWSGSGVAFRVITIQPQEIDAAVYSRRKNKFGTVKGLNRLEAIKMAEIIDTLPEARTFYIDAPDKKAKRFGNMVYSLSHSRPKIIARNFADRDFVVVGAASIIAKVTRDRLLEKLKHQVGVDFGSGYVSDPKTKAFVKELLIEGKPLPPYIRKSWKTIKNIEDGMSTLDTWALS